MESHEGEITEAIEEAHKEDLDLDQRELALQLADASRLAGVVAGGARGDGRVVVHETLEHVRQEAAWYCESSRPRAAG